MSQLFGSFTSQGGCLHSLASPVRLTQAMAGNASVEVPGPFRVTLRRQVVGRVPAEKKQPQRKAGPPDSGESDPAPPFSSQAHVPPWEQAAVLRSQQNSQAMADVSADQRQGHSDILWGTGSSSPSASGQGANPGTAGRRPSSPFSAEAGPREQDPGAESWSSTGGRDGAAAGAQGQDEESLLGFVQARFDSFARYTVAAFKSLSSEEHDQGSGPPGAATISMQDGALPSSTLHMGSNLTDHATARAQHGMASSNGTPASGMVQKRHVSSSAGAGGAPRASSEAAYRTERDGVATNHRRATDLLALDVGSHQFAPAAEPGIGPGGMTAAAQGGVWHSSRVLTRAQREALQRAEAVRVMARSLGKFLGRLHRLGLPETSWRNKMPYREPRAPFLARGLKWPEEQHFASEAEKRNFIRQSRVVQGFMFGEIPSWSWIAADVALFAFLTCNPKWPWSLN